jgi:sorbitol-specific phosphotransferase system component IIA
MRRFRSALLLAGGFLCILPAGRAQEITLETRAGATTALYCEMLHSTLCAMAHVESTTRLTVGASLQLDGKAYVITWVGPGYYLETGVVLEAQGETATDLKGQRWAETNPHGGTLHVSRAWRDTDQNGALSVNDTLALDDGPEVAVKDVRLHVRVRPVPEKKEKKEKKEE